MPRKPLVKAHIRKPSAIHYDDITLIVDRTILMTKQGVKPVLICNSIFREVNKARSKHRRGRTKRVPKEQVPDHNYMAGSTLGREESALIEARKILGLRAEVIDDWGTCRVGVKLSSGEFKAYGQGSSWEAALDAARVEVKRKLVKTTSRNGK